MPDFEYPKVSILDTVYNVTKMFTEEGARLYTSAQGYTVTPGPNRIHFITSLRSDDNVAIAHVMGKQSSDGAVSGQYSIGKNYGHANDCAYYDSGFFIVQGGGKKDDGEEDNEEKGTQIIRLDNTLDGLTSYNYQPLPNESDKVQEIETDQGKKKIEALKAITGIAHIKGDYFALSQGMRVSICELHSNTQIFKEIARFAFSKIGDHLSRGEDYKRIGQGIYCAGSKIYKAFSYEKKFENIKRNDIGIFKFNSSTPSTINKATFLTSYSCDQIGKDLFEIESLGSPNGGSTMYMLTNVDEDGQKDTLYKVSFS